MTESKVLARSRMVDSGASSRLSSLDGLRGIASLIVVAFHATALSPEVADFIVGGGAAPQVFSNAWWVTSTPLKYLTAGDEAVFVFFVLSGLVLTLPAIRNARFDWLAFQASRVVRLFLPVVASLALSFLLVRMWDRVPTGGISSWLQYPYNPSDLSLRQVLQNTDLLFSDFVVNGPTWTIRWELIFSFLLPVAIGLVLFVVRRIWIGLIGTAILIFAGLETGSSSLVYLPIFLLGVILAMNLDQLEAQYREHLKCRPTWTKLWVAATAVLGILAFGAFFLLKPYVDSSGFLAVAARIVSIYGAALIVSMIAVVNPRGGLLSTPPFRWMGQISFSLYLVHQPVLATIAFIFGSDAWAISAVCGFLLSVIVAIVFYWAVERRSHRLARGFGRWVSRDVRLRAAS